MTWHGISASVAAAAESNTFCSIIYSHQQSHTSVTFYTCSTVHSTLVMACHDVTNADMRPDSNIVGCAAPHKQSSCCCEIADRTVIIASIIIYPPITKRSHMGLGVVQIPQICYLPLPLQKSNKHRFNSHHFNDTHEQLSPNLTFVPQIPFASAPKIVAG